MGTAALVTHVRRALVAVVGTSYREIHRWMHTLARCTRVARACIAIVGAWRGVGHLRVGANA